MEKEPTYYVRNIYSCGHIQWERVLYPGATGTYRQRWVCPSCEMLVTECVTELPESAELLVEPIPDPTGWIGTPGRAARFTIRLSDGRTPGCWETVEYPFPRGKKIPETRLLQMVRSAICREPGAGPQPRKMWEEICEEMRAHPGWLLKKFGFTNLPREYFSE